MLTNLRFIEAKYTPFGGNSGCAVPTQQVGNKFHQTSIKDTKEMLEKIGLVNDQDFKIHEHYFSNYKGEPLLKRVVFKSDEAFIMAKMSV